MEWRSILFLCSALFFWGCGDEFKDIDEPGADDTSQLENAITKNGLGAAAAFVGDSCASGCVWSSFAVSFGAQNASHSCVGTACSCVQNGNIFQACQPSIGQNVSGQGGAFDFFGQDESSPQESQPNIFGQAANQQPVLAGTSCGQSCVWSSFAVQLGAQPGERPCGFGGQCACVEFGNVWLSCGAGGQASQPAPAPSPAPQFQPAAPAPQANGFGGQYNASMGNRLADVAYRIATSRNTVGNCYNAAADAIETIVSPFLYGMSAYMAADQLAFHPRFSEISTGNLAGLPAGAVVVWGKGSSEHGHISIALGDGREASDHVAGQMLWHYGGAPARVFLPR